MVEKCWAWFSTYFLKFRVIGFSAMSEAKSVGGEQAFGDFMKKVIVRATFFMFEPNQRHADRHRPCPILI